MSQTLIIADDLSGAADCASAFFKAEQETLVVIDWKAGQCAGTRNTQVIAIDADTRRLAPADAAAVHRKMFERYRSPGQLLYKKIDSTLRGNFAQELAAIVKDAGLAIVAPAFPLAGRFTRRGHQYLKDVPLENSEVWRAEGIAGTAHIPGMLSRQGIKTASIEIEDIRHGPSRILALLERFANAGIEAVVCDAETEQDLHVIARASMDLTAPHFCVGSAGLTYHLATVRAAPGKPVPAPSVVTRGAILTVVGSLSSVSREQAQYLEKNVRLARLEIPAEVLRDGPSHSRWNEFHHAAAQSLRDQRDLLVVIEKGASVNMSEGLELCQALAALIAPLANHIGAVISTGGETARAILSAIGSKGLFLAGEIESGVPLSVAAGIKPMPIITKAGAFGSLDTLLRCYQRLQEARIDDAVPASNSLQRKSSMYRPIIAITMGDAAGVGPEIIIKSLVAKDLYEQCRPLVIGDLNRLREAGKIVGSPLQVHAIEDIKTARYEYGMVECVDLGLIPPGYPFGQLSPLCGHAAYCYIERAVRLAVNQEIDAICTAPLNKEALHAGGHIFPGHTEMLAKLTDTPEVSMMLVAPNLRVIHVTTHIGLLDAIRKIEPGLVERTIARGYDTLVLSGIANPRIGVCGINPHAGENGLFGYGEEEEKIIPAVKAQQALGRSVEGPLPADTLFFRAARGDFDLVVAMYHDQGHGPVKVMGLESGVNVTVGLPVIRTSVDHGTAFDIAGKGIADEGSMREALHQAVSLATRRD